MKTKKIVLAPQDTIKLFEPTGRVFFREVLDQNFDECLVTDESYLGDWSSCGMPGNMADQATSSASEATSPLAMVRRSSWFFREISRVTPERLVMFSANWTDV